MTQPTALVPASNREMIDKVRGFGERAKSFVVSDAESYAGAMASLQEVRTFIKELDENRKELTRPLDEAKKSIMAEYRPAEDALKAADYALVSATSKWSREQAEAQRKAEQAAREKAERERQRAEQKAEEYREKGREDKAQEWETKAAFTPQPVVPNTVPKVAGVNTRKVWKFEIVDAGKIPAKYLMPDEKMIAGVVKAMGGNTEIPGVHVWSEDIPVASRL